MGPKEYTYTFFEHQKCNMCGSPQKDFRLLGRRMKGSLGYNPRRILGISVSVIKCRQCGLIFSSPHPIPADIKDHYNIDPNLYWKAPYFDESEVYYTDTLDILRKLQALTVGMRVLDVGAGIGKGMTAMKKQGCDVWGIEPSAPFHAMACEKMGIDEDRLLLSSIEEAEFPENFFDFVTFGAVLEHVHDPAGAIEKALQWLRPNGLIHAEVPSARWLINRIVRLYYRLIGTDFVGHLSPMHKPYHLYEFDLDSFIIHGKKTGYIVEHHQYFVCQTYLPKILDPFLKPLMKATRTGMQLTVYLRSL